MYNMDMTQAMRVMQNPQQYVMEQLAKQNPDIMRQCQSMFSGKNHRQQVQALRNLYKQKGMDLDTVAKQWRIQL